MDGVRGGYGRDFGLSCFVFMLFFVLFCFFLNCCFCVIIIYFCCCLAIIGKGLYYSEEPRL